MVVLVAYSAWVYPLEVAFMDAIPRRGLLIADNVVDLFFAIDIFVTFFVAYIDHRTQLLVRDSKKIAIRLQFFHFYFISILGFWNLVFSTKFWLKYGFGNLELWVGSEMKSLDYDEIALKLDVHGLNNFGVIVLKAKCV